LLEGKGGGRRVKEKHVVGQNIGVSRVGGGKPQKKKKNPPNNNAEKVNCYNNGKKGGEKGMSISKLLGKNSKVKNLTRDEKVRGKSKCGETITAMQGGKSQAAGTR